MSQTASVSAWDSVQQSGSFQVRWGERFIECIVPLETLIDRFATKVSAPEETFTFYRNELEAVALMLIRRGFGRGGRIVLRGIDFLALPEVSQTHRFHASADTKRLHRGQTMQRRHFSAAELLGLDPSIRCFDCRKRLQDSPDHETWSYFVGNYFCLQCSRAEKLAATSDEQDLMNHEQSIRNRPG